ncbi:sugar phosphate nucleotidyltransferase [Haloarchaeobius sp. HRN-SO-5]|uniref:sugar phosphate nucleotidyltransferase n=1 Tax=Haloarchaeobius sp. HRN-SO-5 TaxID=3446118 RepID=UPI003EB76EAD
MDAIVLAAGKGTRLRPLTEDRPKGLVEVGGKPILEDCLDQLVSLGVDHLVVVVGYEGGQIVDHFGDDHRGCPIDYAVQEERDGVASALLAAEDEVESESFLVMLGDNVFRANLGAVVAAQEGDADGSVLVEEVPRSEASRYGVCRLDADGGIDTLVEKPDDPPSTLVATGMYSFTTAVFDDCRRIEPSDRGEYEISDAISAYAEDNHVEPVRLEGWRVDVGYPADRDEVERRLAGERAASQESAGVVESSD